MSYLLHEWVPGAPPLASPLAVDTETRSIGGPLDVPDLALVVAADATRSVWVHPAHVGAFLRDHRAHKLCGYNVAFDFWVLDRTLAGFPAGRVLWDCADAGRLICLRMLWRLIELARSGHPDPRGTLADCHAEFVGGPGPDKTDAYRMRYGELVGLDPEAYRTHPEIEGFLSYALADARATRDLLGPMESVAQGLMLRAGWNPSARGSHAIHPEAVRYWGPLTVGIQTRASIALEKLSREPLRIDTGAVAAQVARARTEIEALAEGLERGAPGIWKRYKKTGELIRGDKGNPQRSQAALVWALQREARDANRPVLLTEKGVCSLSSADWAEHLPESPWVKDWHGYELQKKRLSTVLEPLSAGVVYGHYEPLLRSGRTSCAKYRDLPSVNIQQTPRDGACRALFVADEGCTRLTVDYSYLELRTLGATCQARYGFSHLADACRAHTRAVLAGERGVPDPHEVMGAAILGVETSQWFDLPPAQRKAARQKAKPVNFGFPGGLGCRRFVAYAEGQYGVSLTLAEAKKLKALWYDTYPEMRRWLGDTTLPNLAHNLQAPLGALVRSAGNLWHLRQVLEGYRDDEALGPVLRWLRSHNRNPVVTPLLDRADGSTEWHDELCETLLRGPSVTLTGRVRGYTGYADGANNPFQGLAADGAKEALWRLMHAGYKVKAFIHDEVLVDLAQGEPSASARVRRVHEIMNRAMEEVMGNDVPSHTEGHLAPTWVKG